MTEMNSETEEDQNIQCHRIHYFENSLSLNTQNIKSITQRNASPWPSLIQTL